MHIKFVLIFSSSLIALSSADSKLSCDQQLITTDKCVQRAMFVADKEVPVPKNIRELEHNCQKIKREIRCIHDFKRCLKPFPKSMFNVVLYNIKKVIKSVCDTLAGKQELIRHLRCFRPEDVSIMNTIMNKNTAIADYVSKSVPTDLVIPHLCCSHFVLNMDGKKVLDDLCVSRTGKATSDYFLGLIGAAASDAIELGCGKYSSVTACDEHLPQGMAAFRRILSGPIPSPGHSPAVPFTKIMERLDSEISTD